MASSSTHPDAASKKSILKPVTILEGHEWTDKYPGSLYHNICISYFPDGEQMISGSGDNTVRRWDLQAGKEFKEARYICEQEVWAVGVSRDGRWVVTAGGDDFNHAGELKVWEVETGIVRTFEGHSGHIRCIDISADSTLLASSGVYDTVRVWSLDTGQLIFEIADATGPGAVRFSQDSKKLAVNSSVAKCLQVWDIKTQKLVVRVGKEYASGVIKHASVFWTTKDKTIVAAFNFKYDDYNMTMTDIDRREYYYDEPKTIYEFDASTLQTVGAPFEGHIRGIHDLALSFDGAILAGACLSTIKLWAFESRQLLASFDIGILHHLIFSPNSHQLAYTIYPQTDLNIYICDIPPHILTTIQSTQEAQPNISAATNPQLLNSNATRRATRRNPIQSPIFPRPQRDFPTIYPQEHTFLRYLRKMLPSRMTPVRTDQPRDPLDFPATLPLPHSTSPSGQATSHAHSDMNPQNARHISAPKSSATAPTTFKTRPHHLSTWWPARATHASPPIVDVPLAPGKLRYATAGAPTFDEDLIRDEDYVPSTPPSPHPNSQRPSTGVQVTAGQHGSGRLCGCF